MKRCPVCFSKKITSEPFYYIWENSEWVIHRCLVCTHQFIYPFLKKVEQEKIYNDLYFSGKGDWSCSLFCGGYIDSESELRMEANEVLDMIPIRNKGKLLEIGCSGGFLLDEAKKRGFEVRGIEPNKSMSLYGQNILGINIINKRIEDMSEGELRKYDIIVLMDVLEHIPQSYDAMKKIGCWLNDEGYILIRGPLSNDPYTKLKEWLRRIFGKKKQLPGYPLDVNLFNKKSLTYLLNQFGIGVISWIDESKGFANILAQKTTEKRSILVEGNSQS